MWSALHRCVCQHEKRRRPVRKTARRIKPDMPQCTVFPPETENVGRPVTQVRLARAKFKAVRLLMQYRDDIKTTFESFCFVAYEKCTRVKVDMDDAIRRARVCKIDPFLENVWGESNDEDVAVSDEFPMTDAELVGTIMHEALHYVCRLDRGYGWRDLCTRVEHEVMEFLGDIQ